MWCSPFSVTTTEYHGRDTETRLVSYHPVQALPHLSLRQQKPRRITSVRGAIRARCVLRVGAYEISRAVYLSPSWYSPRVPPREGKITVTNEPLTGKTLRLEAREVEALRALLFTAQAQAITRFQLTDDDDYAYALIAWGSFFLDKLPIYPRDRKPNIRLS